MTEVDPSAVDGRLLVVADALHRAWADGTDAAEMLLPGDCLSLTRAALKADDAHEAELEAWCEEVLRPLFAPLVIEALRVNATRPHLGSGDREGLGEPEDYCGTISWPEASCTCGVDLAFEALQTLGLADSNA